MLYSWVISLVSKITSQLANLVRSGTIAIRETEKKKVSFQFIFSFNNKLKAICRTNNKSNRHFYILNKWIKSPTTLRVSKNPH